MISKPDEETELPGSNESPADEEAAIEHEREKRLEDRHGDPQ